MAQLNILTKSPKHKFLLKFVFRAVGLALLYFLVYKFLRYNLYVHVVYEQITFWLTRFLLEVTQTVMGVFGLEVQTDGKLVWITGHTAVYLDRGCLGRTVLAGFTGLLVVFPGKLKSKLWFIPLGIVVINALNVLRISVLIYIAAYYPQHLEVNHHYIFKLVVWSGIFLLWFYWINKYGGK